MPPPTWVPGQVLASSDVNTWFVPLAAYKAADTSRSSTATPANDPDLTLALGANSVYEVRFSLSYTSTSGTPGFAFLFTVPSGATGLHLTTYWTGASSQQTALDDTWTTQRNPYISGTGNWGLAGQGLIITTNSGSLTLQWSQGTSNATATVLQKGSYLVANRIS